MIDQEKKQALLTGLRSDDDVANDIVEAMTPEESEALWQALKSRRKDKSLAELNLEHELLEQYEAVKTLQEEVLVDSDIPPNQRAQVANAVAATLQQLVKMQSDFYNAERFKAIEALMIKAMKKLPKEVVEEFIDEYEAIE